VFFKKTNWQSFAKISPIQRIFLGKKMAQIHQVLKKEKSNLPDFYDKFH
jgi:hypothetical protein